MMSEPEVGGMRQEDYSKDYSSQQQTTNHMVNVCPFTKFGGGLMMMQSTDWSLP